MLQKFLLSPLLLLSISMLCWHTRISAHDAFYPHHREDFENITRRRELRTTVLLSTAAFLCVLGAVVYFALRRSTDNDDDVDEIDTKTAQEHLEHATKSAVSAARQVLDTKGDIAEAVTVCFATYADMAGVTWHPPSYGQNRPESVPYQIRCKIGSDIVTLNIDSEAVQLKAEHTPSKIGLGSQEASKTLRATVVLRRFKA